MNELAVREDATAIQVFNPEQMDLLKRTICRGATDDEFQLFVHVAQKTGLDPFARQIHAVRRWDAQSQREVMSIQTGIDGYRLIADRTGEYLPGREPSYEYTNDGQVVKATAYVMRMGKDGQYHEVAAAAFYDEYAQKKKDGSPTRMWAQMPHVMLAKCAEAQALRRAFPAEMSGVYTHEEMQQADVVDVEPTRVESRQSAKSATASPAPEPQPAPAPASAAAPAKLNVPAELAIPTDDERQQYQQRWVAIAATRQLDRPSSAVFLKAAFAKRGAQIGNASKKLWDDAIAAFEAGTFDAAIQKLAAARKPAAPAPAAPAPAAAAPAPESPAALGADSQVTVYRVATVTEFEEAAAGMCPESMRNEAYRAGLDAWYGSLRKPQNISNPEQISAMKLNECLEAMSRGDFDWAKGKISSIRRRATESVARATGPQATSQYAEATQAA